MGRRWVAALGVAVALVVLASGPGAPHVRAQSSTHRAAVIIDTGATVKHVCIFFRSDYISGKDVLDAANQADPSIQPTYVNYGDMGAFVCSLCGVGNPQSDCTGSKSSDHKYWAYTRAPNGTTKFAVSSEGVSNSQVHDGDVEGWRWGTGGAPAYASVDQVCGTLATDGTFTPTSMSSDGGPPQAIAVPAPSAAAPQQRSRSAQPAPSGAGPSSSTTTPTVTGAATPTSVADSTSSSGPTGTALAHTPHDGGGGGGASWAGLGAFAAIGTGLGGWFLWLRRARKIVP